jgi:hypothetical protein
MLELLPPAGASLERTTAEVEVKLVVVFAGSVGPEIRAGDEFIPLAFGGLWLVFKRLWSL